MLLQITKRFAVNTDNILYIDYYDKEEGYELLRIYFPTVPICAIGKEAVEAYEKLKEVM